MFVFLARHFTLKTSLSLFMTFLPRLRSRPHHHALLAVATGLLFLALTALADDDLLNLHVSTPPPGTNPAVFPVPRAEWLVHFQRSVDRSKQGNVDLVFDGDSITDFWMGAGKEVWAKNYGGLNAVDYGISGDRTEHLLWRLDHGQVAGLHPKMIALMIGTNNAGNCTEAQIAEGITAIVHEYQKLCPDAVILLQAVFPRSEKPTDSMRGKIKGINTLISKLGDGKKVVYVDFGDKFLQPDGTISRDVMPDFLHPNAKGYQIWADAIRPEIEKVFGPTPPAK